MEASERALHAERLSVKIRICPAFGEAEPFTANFFEALSVEKARLRNLQAAMVDPVGGSIEVPFEAAWEPILWSSIIIAKLSLNIEVAWNELDNTGVPVPLQSSPFPIQPSELNCSEPAQELAADANASAPACRHLQA